MPPDTLESLQQNSALLFQLQFVIEMLVLAPSARPEIFAARTDPFWCSCDDFGLCTTQKALLYPVRFYLDRFTRQDQRNQNHLTVKPAEAISTVDQLFNADGGTCWAVVVCF